MTMIRKVLPFTALLFASLLLAGCEFSLAADVTPPPGARLATPLSQPETVASGPTYPLVAPNPASGAPIYAEKCSPCHGDLGMGDGAQGAQLPNPVPAIGRVDKARTAVPSSWYSMVTNGNLERFMPPFASLSEGQRWDVIAYVLSLSTSEEQLAQGEALYQDNCAACHGAEGRGDGPGAANLPASPTNFLNQELMASRSANDLFESVQTGVGDAMPAYGDQLTEDEIWSLAAYIRQMGFATSPATEVGSVPESPSEGSTVPETGQTGEQSVPENPATGEKPAIGKGIVSGQVINASGGAIPGDVSIMLNGFDHMQLVYTATTNANSNGTYLFEGVDFTPERVYVVSTDFGGATYGSDVAIVEPGKGEIDLPLTIYDATQDTSELTVDRLHVFFDFSRENVVQVVQLYVISNPSEKTVVSSTENGGVVEFTLPEGATNLQFQDGQLGDRFLQSPQGFLDTAPVRPGQGQYQVMYAFDIPYDRKADLIQEFTLPIDAMIVMTPADGVKLRSDFLQDTGSRDVQGETYEMYTGDSLPAGRKLEYTLSGLPGDAGMLGFMSSSTSGTSLVVGLAALGLVLVGAGVWLYRRNARDLEPLGAPEDFAEQAGEAVDQVYDDPETIMDAIIALDDLYAAGEIPEDAYLQRRSVLKELLKESSES